MTRRRSSPLVTSMPQGRAVVSRVAGPEASPDRHAIRQAAAWLDAGLATKPIPPLVIAVGFGGGHLLDVLDERAPETRVLALEPDPVAARAFLARTDRNQWRERDRLLYLAGPDYAGADGAWRLFPATGAYLLLVHPAVAQDTSTATGALQTVKRIVYGVKANADARRRLAPRYLANVLRNVPAIAAGHDVRALTDVYRGVPAIVAAAGPSLDAALDDLRATQGRALLIAVDTALRPLLHARITPHLVVGADPSDLNARHFQALPACPDTWLVAESALDRSATRIFDNRTFWFRLARHHPWPWLNEIGIDIGHMEMWGSVLTAAFQVACVAGCDPIVLVGADLAFTNGRPYCRGTTYEFDWAAATACGQTLDDVWQARTSRGQVCRVPDLHGSDTITTSSMLSFRDWMLAAASRSDRRVINATGAGILSGSGIAQASMQEALPEVHSPLLREAIAAAPRLSAPRDLAANLAKIREVLHTSRTASAPVAAWSAFVGDAFDPSALCRIVDVAIHEVDGTGTLPVSPSTIDWSRLAVLLQTRDLLRHLPEATARLQTVLTGDRPPPDHANQREPSDRVTLLIEAAELFVHLARSVQHADSLQLPSNRSLITNASGSALHGLPKNVRWNVAIFQALLGEACAPGGAAVGPAFLERPVVLKDSRASLCTPTAAAARLDTPRALFLLGLEWLSAIASIRSASSESLSASAPAAESQAQSYRAVSDPPGSSAGPTPNERQHLKALLNALRRAVQTIDGAPDSTIRIRAGGDALSEAIDLSIPIRSAALARVLTGAIGVDRHPSIELAHFAVSGVSASISVQRLADLNQTPTGQAAGSFSRSMRQPLVVTPRVLTDEDMAPAMLMYRTDRGVVAVINHDTRSLIVRPDGTTETHHVWPRPIVAELPFGTDGAVAWGNGLAMWPKVGSAYVMYRRHTSDDVSVQELPIRPAIGTWWQERLYWCCFPDRTTTWVGVASWVPDAQPTCELPDLVLFGMHPRGDRLHLEPCQYDPVIGYSRQRASTGWTWQGGPSLEPIALDAYGAASFECTADTWTATTSPESDLITLESSDGRATSLLCYYPLRALWLGRSLLVSTIQREVLLFENLLDILDETC